MKLRQGFVSNSSSSSFLIAKAGLTQVQIKLIKHHKAANLLFNQVFGEENDGLNFEWTIYNTENYLCGEVYMDNFDMANFLGAIGIPRHSVQWQEYKEDFDIAEVHNAVRMDPGELQVPSRNPRICALCAVPQPPGFTCAVCVNHNNFRVREET